MYEDSVKNVHLHSLNFHVSPSTFALAVAYSDSRCTQDTKVAETLFRAHKDAIDAASVGTE